MSSNFPDGYMAPTDPRSPLHHGIDNPTCDECGEDLALDADCDEDGMYPIAYCDNPECDECGN